MRKITYFLVIAIVVAIIAVSCRKGPDHTGTNNDNVYVDNDTTSSDGSAVVSIDEKEVSIHVQSTNGNTPVSNYFVNAASSNNMLLLTGMDITTKGSSQSMTAGGAKKVFEWAPMLKVVHLLTDNTEIIAKVAPIIAVSKIFDVTYAIYDYFIEEDRPHDWELIFNPSNNVIKYCVVGDINDVYKPLSAIVQLSRAAVIFKSSLTKYATGSRLKAFMLQMGAGPSNSNDFIQWLALKILSIATSEPIGDDMFTKDYKWCFVNAINPFKTYKDFTNSVASSAAVPAIILINIETIDPDDYDPDDPWEGDWIGTVKEADGFHDEVSLNVIRNGDNMVIKGGIHARKGNSEVFIWGNGEAEIVDQLRNIFNAQIKCTDAAGMIDGFNIDRCSDLYLTRVHLRGNLFFHDSEPRVYVKFDEALAKVLGVPYMILHKEWP